MDLVYIKKPCFLRKKATINLYPPYHSHIAPSNPYNKIHEWLNFVLNNLSKLINIFNTNSNQKFEKIKNKITRQINKNKKQSDYTNMNWKNWIHEIFIYLQNFKIWLFKFFLRSEQTNVKTCDDKLLSNVKKKQNLTNNKWRDEKLSSFNNYFQN